MQTLKEHSKIAFLVLAAHLLLLSTLFIQMSAPILESPKRFSVKTISLKTANIEDLHPSEKKEILEKPTPLNVDKDIQKKAEKEPSKKKALPKKDPEKKRVDIVKETPIKKPANEALAKAKKALSNIQSVSSEKPIALGPKIETLHIEGLEGSGYLSELVVKLQKSLKLPESGEVVIELTLEKSGKVQKMMVKEAKSDANKLYIEKTLPSLKFPVFEGHLKHESLHTFTFVLNSDSSF